MGIIRKIVKATTETVKVLDEVMPPLPKPAPKKQNKKGDRK
ncbi:hypothetical protein [Amycolatopsis japonica]